MKKKIKKFAEGGLNIRDREALNLKNRAALNVDKTSATRDVPIMNRNVTRVAPNTFQARNGFNQNMVTQKGYDSATPVYEEYYRRRGRAGGPEKLPINTPNVDRRFYLPYKKLIGYDAVKNVPGVRQETYETPRERLNLNSYGSLQLKKGGAVKGKKCRMDGIAVRGKTRAKQRSK